MALKTKSSSCSLQIWWVFIFAEKRVKESPDAAIDFSGEREMKARVNQARYFAQIFTFFF